MTKVPTVNLRGFKPNTPVTSLVNNIRAGASDAFKEYLPLANADNVDVYKEAFANNPALLNEWAIGLINRIGETIMKQNSFADPLQVFKKNPLQFGSTTQEIYNGYIDAQEFSYDEGTKDVFKRSLPDIKSKLHEINSKKKWPITISEFEINRAFVSWDGVNTLIDQTLGRLMDSFNLYEYHKMRMLFDQAYADGSLLLVEVGDATNDADAAKRMVVAARTYSKLVKFPKPYTPAGVLNTSPIEDTYLVTSAQTSSNIEVNVDAAAYNIDKVGFLSNPFEIDEFGDDNIQGIMFNRNFFVVQDSVNTIKNIYNPSNMEFQFFYHAQQVYSYSPFNVAIAFVKKIPDELRPRIVLDSVTAILSGKSTFSGKLLFDLRDNETVEITADTIPDSLGKKQVLASAIKLSDDNKSFTYDLDKTGDAKPSELVQVVFTVTVTATKPAVGDEQPVTTTNTATVTQYVEIK